ncbi:MAG: HAD hydrolase family protein [Candidatus Omnitrophota bacterium]
MDKRIKKIKVLALDVDGILTDGRIIFDSRGTETKFFDVQDGFGLVLFKRLGYKTAIITARASKVVALRAKDLNIDKVYQDAYPKMDAYKKMLRHFGVKDNQVCFVGDDLPDLPVLKKVGFAVTVPNGVAEVKKAAHYVTKKSGGKGAVREVIELILKTQGRWPDVLKRYQS